MLATQNYLAMLRPPMIMRGAAFKGGAGKTTSAVTYLPSSPGNPQLRCSVHDEVVLTVEEKHKDAAIAWVFEHMAAAEREVVKDPESPIVVDVAARESW